MNDGNRTTQGEQAARRERLAQLEKRLVELKGRLPKHSVPAAMIIELEDLEDEIEALRTQVGHGQG
jgi:transcription elongation GreA/GreB family factor